MKAFQSIIRKGNLTYSTFGWEHWLLEQKLRMGFNWVRFPSHTVVAQRQEDNRYLVCNTHRVMYRTLTSIAMILWGHNQKQDNLNLIKGVAGLNV